VTWSPVAQAIWPQPIAKNPRGLFYSSPPNWIACNEPVTTTAKERGRGEGDPDRGRIHDVAVRQNEVGEGSLPELYREDLDDRNVSH